MRMAVTLLHVLEEKLENNNPTNCAAYEGYGVKIFIYVYGQHYQNVADLLSIIAV